MEIELCCQNEINGSQTFLENQDYTINSDFMEIQSEFIEKQEPNQISSTNYEEISHDQNQIQQNNLQSQNEKNQSNDNEGNLNRKSKQSKRKKNNKQVGLMNLYQNINSKNVIRLSSGLLLDLDGTIRFSNSLGFFSFGSSAWQAQNLIYQKQYKVISCSVADVSNQKQISIPDALEILNVLFL